MNTANDIIQKLVEEMPETKAGEIIDDDEIVSSDGRFGKSDAFCR